jgi:hypothetical protein
MNAKSHILISGTGRAGITFLVQLLKELGFDIGKDHYFEIYRAGLEHDVRYKIAGYIVKSPCLCDQLGSILKDGEVFIEYLIEVFWNLFSPTESIRQIQMLAQETH